MMSSDNLIAALNLEVELSGSLDLEVELSGSLDLEVELLAALNKEVELIGHVGIAFHTDRWLLTEGIWDDTGIWDDDAFWNDGVDLGVDGKYQIACVYGGRVYMSTDHGLSFAEAAPAGVGNRNWSLVAISNDIAVAGVLNGRLYLHDGSWSEIQPAGDVSRGWNVSAIEGSKIAVGSVLEGGRLYLSINSGSTWSEIQPYGNNDHDYGAVIIDDGDVFVRRSGLSVPQLSTNNGGSWMDVNPGGGGSKRWRAMAKKGNDIVLGIGDSAQGRLYLSENKGVNWSEIQPAGDVDKYWTNAFIDGDMILVTDETKVYRSLNKGSTWTEANDFEITGSQDMHFSASHGGRFMLCGVFGGRLHKSNNYGADWYEIQPVGDINRNWIGTSINRTI